MERAGEQFIHKKDPKLHTSHNVEHEMKRKKRRGEDISQKPKDKISDWLNVIERTHMGHYDDERVLDRIKRYYHKEYVISPDEIPESYYENQQRLAREEGRGDIEITEEAKKQLNEVIISDQKSSLDNWIDYLISEYSDSFPMWAKYYVFNGMLKLSTYDKKKHMFGKRDKHTVAPFPDLNKENIPDEEDNEELQKLLQGTNFGKLYA